MYTLRSLMKTGLVTLLVAALASGPLQAAQGARIGRGTATPVQVRAPEYQLEILSFEDGLPRDVEIRGEAAVVRETLDFRDFLGVSWESLYTDSEGWSHGRLTKAGFGGVNVTLDFRFQESDAGLHLEMTPAGYAGSPARFLLSRVSTDRMQIEGAARASGFLGKPLSPVARADCGPLCVIGIIVVAAITCAVLQDMVMEGCAEAARVACGQWNVRRVWFTGFCGVWGECQHECK